MTRANIHIDDRLVENVMRRYGVTTKREAVEIASDGGLQLDDVRPGFQPWDE